MRKYAYFMVCACAIISVHSIDPEVQTTTGRIRGFSKSSYNAKIVNTYLGIPFAEPPIGDLRFQRPVPIQNWTDTLECKDLPNSCPQIKFESFKGEAGGIEEESWNYNTNASEDCLYLNIWAPAVQPGTKLTTLIWIYGGGFMTGSSTLRLYDGNYLAAYTNTIVVSLNYRLGPFGFLYLNQQEAPGNMGLLDQVIALEWLHNNIESFGGDKNSITVFGESAGAASVTYLMASELSKHYFQRAIIQSASFLASWAYQDPTIAKQYAKLLAAEVACGGLNDLDTVRCLRNVPENDLTLKSWNLNMTHFQWPFAPTLDNHFIFKNPTEILQTANFSNKDLMFGFNTDEGTYFLLYYLKGAINYPTSQNMTRKHFLDEIPFIISSDGFSYVTQDKDKLLFDAMLFYYNTWSPDTTREYYFQILDAMAGDFNFKCPVVDIATSISQSPSWNGTLYGYYFDQLTSASDWPDWTGVLHGDEIEYVFGLPLDPQSQHSSNEQWLSRYMMEYWASFAKTGHPDVQRWKEFTADNQQYGLLKGGRELSMQTIDYTRTCQFWSDYIPRLKESYTSMNACVNKGQTPKQTVFFLVATLTLTFLSLIQ